MCNECGYKHSEDNDTMSIVICGDCLRADCKGCEQ
jgi:hypothetical protein